MTAQPPEPQVPEPAQPDPPAPDPAPPGLSPRGGETRRRIVEAALRLFEERGYEKTTMRAVATEAGVSLGNAYYYFDSKDDLVQGFYQRQQEQHLAEARAVIAREPDVTQRLLLIERAFLDISRPFHQFAGSFFAVAADPKSPNSPFSPRSRAAREGATEIFREAVAGTDLVVDKELAPRLPDLLWLSHMGVVLHWVHDDSPDQRRTRLLIDRVVPLGVRLLRLTRRRPARPLVRQFLSLLDDLQDPPASV